LVKRENSQPDRQDYADRAYFYLGLNRLEEAQSTVALANLRDGDAAFEWLEKAFEKRAPFLAPFEDLRPIQPSARRSTFRQSGEAHRHPGLTVLACSETPLQRDPQVVDLARPDPLDLFC